MAAAVAVAARAIKVAARVVPAAARAAGDQEAVQAVAGPAVALAAAAVVAPAGVAVAVAPEAALAAILKIRPNLQAATNFSRKAQAELVLTHLNHPVRSRL